MARAHLTPTDRRHLARLLRSQRSELDTELGSLTDSLDEVRLARSDGTADDEHDPEGPTLSSEWSRISGVHGELVAKSHAIDRALLRITNESYGLCFRCGEPIGLERLQVRPAAELCIECARRAESARR